MCLISFLVMFSQANAASINQVKEVEEQYKDWVVVDGTGGTPRYNAITTSSGGEELLAFSCHVNDACYLTMLIKASCDLGEGYPLLINADSGAAMAQGICIDNLQDEGFAEYRIEDPGAVFAETVYSDTRIGIAIPMASGKFRAVRFSLIGSQEAMARAVELSQAKIYHKEDSIDSGDF